MPPPVSSARLLVVDDDAGLLKLMQKTLGREGFQVAAAASGGEALQVLEGRTFDLLLVDLRLADMSGQEFLREMAERGHCAPFAVITGQGDERVAVEMMKQGALDYLVKDAEFLDTMPTRVRRAVEMLEQKQRLLLAEEALKREHAFIAAVLDTAGALVVVLDAEGRIVRFNRAAEKLIGYTTAEAAGRSYLELFVPEEERAGVEPVFDKLVSGEAFNEHQNRIRTRSGQMPLITWSNTHLRNSAGKIEFVIATGIDITERRRLEAQLLDVSGREQRRIGQDLHDGLGQHLTGIELMSQCLEQALAKKKRPEALQAAKIAQHVREAIRQTKSLARGLSPVDLDLNGLMSALQELCASTSEICRVECVFDCPEPILVKDHLAATNLYRIAQEAVNNAVKHGRARRIVVRLSRAGEGERCLSIADDGEGFAKNGVQPGMGLQIMRHRAATIGGRLEIAAEPRKGVEVRCTFNAGL